MKRNIFITNEIYYLSYPTPESCDIYRRLENICMHLIITNILSDANIKDVPNKFMKRHKKDI